MKIGLQSDTVDVRFSSKTICLIHGDVQVRKECIKCKKRMQGTLKPLEELNYELKQ